MKKNARQPTTTMKRRTRRRRTIFFGSSSFLFHYCCSFAAPSSTRSRPLVGVPAVRGAAAAAAAPAALFVKRNTFLIQNRRRHRDSSPRTFFYTTAPPSFPSSEAAPSTPIRVAVVERRATSAAGGGGVENCNHLLDVQELHNDYYALRHGQSLANVAGIICSSPAVAVSEYGLSSKGREQALRAGADVVRAYYGQDDDNDDASSTGQRYADLVILSSDFRRAKETAEAVRSAVLADDDDKPPVLYRDDEVAVYDERLRERWFGDYDMTPDSNYEKVWKDDAINPSHSNGGVESANSVMDRVTSCIVEWDSRISKRSRRDVEDDGADNQQQQQRRRRKSMVVCVAHGDVLQILQTAFEKKDASSHRSLPHLETAQLRQLVLSPRRPTP